MNNYQQFLNSLDRFELDQELHESILNFAGKHKQINKEFYILYLNYHRKKRRIIEEYLKKFNITEFAMLEQGTDLVITIHILYIYCDLIYVDNGTKWKLSNIGW